MGQEKAFNHVRGRCGSNVVYGRSRRAYDAQRQLGKALKYWRPGTVTNQNVTRYCRYIDGGETSYGILEGDTIRQLDGFYARGGKPTGKTVKLS